MNRIHQKMSLEQKMQTLKEDFLDRDQTTFVKIRNVVLDPVMVSTSGHRLMPLSRVITPNIPEAEIPAGCTISDEGCFDEITSLLSDKSNVSDLLKAGHLTGDKTTTKLPSARVYTKNTHGTGCTLSSAFAAALAKGEDLTDTAISAKKHIEQAIIFGAEYEIGNGHGPVNHFWSLIK